MFKKNIDNEALTVGSVLLPILEKLGIDTIFGIPGVHTVEIYRGLEKTKIVQEELFLKTGILIQILHGTTPFLKVFEGPLQFCHLAQLR